MQCAAKENYPLSIGVTYIQYNDLCRHVVVTFHVQAQVTADTIYPQ